MLSKNYLLLFSISLASLFLVEYEFTNSSQHSLPQKAILTLDEKLFNLSYKQFDINKETNHYWGYARSKVETQELKVVEVNTTKETEVSKKEGQNLLCISKSCYRLLGIYHEKTSSSITLYNKNLEEKVKVYTTKDMLQNGITVKKIKTHSVIFSEENTTREWIFEIFDVNATQYKPKEK